MAQFQETIECELPLTKKCVVLRGYITGRVKKATTDAFNANATVEDGKVVYTGLAVSESTQAALKGLLISLDGNVENVYEQVLDLPEDDYEFLLAEVNKVKGPLVLTPQNSSKTPTATPSNTEPAA